MHEDQYTWKQFTDAVLDLLTTDKDRAGIDSFRPGMIRQGVIRIQQLVPAFRKNHETLYYPNDFVQEGKASRAVKPPQSAIKSIQLVEVDEEKDEAHRFGLDPWPWDKRFDLVEGCAPVNTGRGWISVDPYGYTFYVYPAVVDNFLVSMRWDGLKLDFQDDESTPFTEPMVNAVRLFVKAEIAREVDKDLAMEAAYTQQFKEQIGLLYVVEQEKRRTKG